MTESQETNEWIKKARRFPDLRSAGQELGLALDQYRHRPNVIVLGIALGGVPVAHEVAKHLGVPLDLVIIRRLLMPRGPGSQTCAVSVAGSLVIDDDLPPLPEVQTTPLDHFLADAIAGLRLREQTCRRGLPPVSLTGKTVLLVDCGIRSSLTMQAAITAIRSQKPGAIIAAVPSASSDGHAKVAALADEVVCLQQPEPFGNVAVWYLDFSRPDDDHVAELLG